MKNKQKILALIISFFILFALAINLKYVPDNYAGNIKNKLPGMFYLILYIGLYNLLSKRKSKKINVFNLILSFILSISYIAIYFINAYETIRYAYINYIQIFKSIIVFIGFSYLFYYTLDYLFNGLDKIRFKETKNKIIKFVFEEHPFISSFIIIILCYIPVMYIFYPGVMMADGLDVLRQYYCNTTATNFWINFINPNVCINTHHSAFYAYILGLIYDLFNNLGHPTFGIFMMVLIQVVLQALVLSYTIKLLKKLKTNYIVRTIILIIFSISQLFSINAVGIFKDIPFSFFCLLLTDFLIEYVYLKEKTKKKIIEILLCSLIVALLSNKGFYIIIFVLLSLIISELKNIKWKSIVFITPIIIYVLYSSILLPTLGVTKGSVREMFPLPFQQIGRYVTYYEDELTDEEIEYISGVLDYSQIKEKYKPQNADYVKDLWDKDYTEEEFKNFIKVYIKLFFKHPGVYINAFFNMTSKYFDFDNLSEMVYYYPNKKTYGEDHIVEDSTQLHPRMIGYTKAFWLSTRYLPVIGLIFNIAFYCWGLIILMIYLITKKQFKNLIPFIPAFVTLLFCLLSPINGNKRYIYPICYCMPILIAYFITIKNLKQEKSHEKKKNFISNN